MSTHTRTCRICRSSGLGLGHLVRVPCNCSGSVGWIHASCHEGELRSCGERCYTCNKIRPMNSNRKYLAIKFITIAISEALGIYIADYIYTLSPFFFVVLFFTVVTEFNVTPGARGIIAGLFLVDFFYFGKYVPFAASTVSAYFEVYQKNTGSFYALDKKVQEYIERFKPATLSVWVKPGRVLRQRVRTPRK